MFDWLEQKPGFVSRVAVETTFADPAELDWGPNRAVDVRPGPFWSVRRLPSDPIGGHTALASQSRSTGPNICDFRCRDWRSGRPKFGKQTAPGEMTRRAPHVSYSSCLLYTS